MCYGDDAFPAPYTPSNANNLQIFFGADNAADYITPLWGATYKSSTGAFCQSHVGSPPYCRYDLNSIRNQLGAELIRLYDWDPRNPHQNFLDTCQQLGIGVLVSVSDYFLEPNGGLPNMDQNIPALIRSYSKDGNYHPAVEGIVMGNEFPPDQYTVPDAVKFTQEWVAIEGAQFPGYRPVPIGHPVSFAEEGGRYPCWYKWDQLLPALSALKSRLFLAPQTYNTAADLFQDFAGTGKGWVDLTYDQYQTPIWFTEIGQDRTKPNYVDVVKGQLSGCLDYSKLNPQKLIGACFFQYADKNWTQGTSEGSFGTWTHAGAGSCTITYSDSDFTHRDADGSGNLIPIGTLNVDVLAKTDLYDAVSSCYLGAS
jgi:hypothetical protein